MVTCTTCNDTHRMQLSEDRGEVMCTHCPTPCRSCANDEGRGPFCAETPCGCACHQRKSFWSATNVAPRPGEWWRHRNGNRYQIMFLANEFTQQADRYPVIVVYQGENDRTWARPLSDWHRSMTRDPAPAPAIPRSDEALLREGFEIAVQNLWIGANDDEGGSEGGAWADFSRARERLEERITGRPSQEEPDRA